MTVGLPQSGKSTWAKAQGYPIVNPDSIRLAIHGQPFIKEAEPFVWATAKYMVRSLFLAGHDVVILDATNITRKRRDEWKGPWDRACCEFWEGSEECKKRAKDTCDDNEHYDSLCDAIDRMEGEAQMVDFEEEEINPITDYTSEDIEKMEKAILDHRKWKKK